MKSAYYDASSHENKGRNNPLTHTSFVGIKPSHY